MRTRKLRETMPMIGGEAAECSALARRPVSDDVRDPYELGWVVDWLYGDAVLPPMPLPPEPEPHAFPRRRHTVSAYEHDASLSLEPRRERGRRRRAPQLALL
jgi:hypothetical protein